MAEFRQVHCRMWRDEWFNELPIDGKLLWLHLITNHATSVAGIYQLPHKFIAFETGIELDRVEELLSEFRAAGKIDYDDDDSVIWVCRMREYQASTSPKVATRIQLDLDTIPNCRVKGIYCKKYGIDTVSIPEPKSASDTDTDTDTDTETETDTESPERANGQHATKTRKRSDKPAAHAAGPTRDTRLYDSAKALATVCKMDFDKNRGRLFTEAKRLNEPAEEIIDHFSAGRWWYANDWRGQRGEPPTPAQVREVWGQWNLPKAQQVKSNGDRANAERAKRYEYTEEDYALAERINAARAAARAAA